MLFTPTVPASNRFSNLDANSLSSQYAAMYGHGATAHIAKLTRDIIYDAAPAQFFDDLKILNAKPAITYNSDEYFYHEVGYGRSAIVTVAHAGNVVAGATQTFIITNPEEVSVDMIIGRSDTNEKGTVTNVTGSTITVTAEAGKTLSQQNIGTAYTWYNHSPVEADGMNTISQYYRIDTIERVNYIQAVIKAQRFGKRELAKYLNSGASTGKNYIATQRKRMMQQFRVDLSNIYWNGNLAEVTLADGHKAKTARGIFPTLQQAGSPNSSVTLSLAPAALEELALDTNYQSYGSVKFFYATPRMIHYISQEYKRDLTRYTPDNMLANLELNEINLGFVRIVFVPMERFNDASSFPTAFRSRGFLLDQASITPVIQFAEEMGDTLPRGKSGTRENFIDTWISADASAQFDNPLGSGWVDVTNLP